MLLYAAILCVQGFPAYPQSIDHRHRYTADYAQGLYYRLLHYLRLLSQLDWIYTKDLCLVYQVHIGLGKTLFSIYFFLLI